MADQPLDPVDLLLAQWARERPDVDASPMGVVGRISRLQRLIDLAQRRTFARFGLDPAAFDVLATLRRSGPAYALTPGDLMRTSMVTSGAITQRLDRLEERGLVTRGPHPDDGRGVLVALTPAGRALVDEVLPAHLATEERLLTALSPVERATLAALLRTLDGSLDDASGTRAGPAPSRESERESGDGDRDRHGRPEDQPAV